MAPRAVDVTAVLIVHDGVRWLPEALAALQAQTVRACTIVAVDTGSQDESLRLLNDALGTVLDHVVQAPRTTGFGAAVAQGLAAGDQARGDAGPTELLWLLHDDCAPAGDVLEVLTDRAADSPSTALLGPKVRDWTDPRLLVEVGLSLDPAGHRATGLEAREHDQGQHDGVGDVLAVGTAAALVRRAVWDEVGGLDPQLPLFRDDVDLGWRINAADHRVTVVPAATIRHARAASTGLRTLHAVDGRAHRVDRRHALHVLLTHASWWRLPFLLVWVPVAAVLRSLGFLLTKRPIEAGDELLATIGVIGRPWRLIAGHRRRSRTRVLPARALGRLFVSRRRRSRQRLDALADRLVGGARPGHADPAVLTDRAGGPARAGGRTGGRGVLLLRPPVLLGLTLVALTVAGAWGLLPGQGGVLAGGRLLPPPDGARDLWDLWTGSWQEVSVGSPLAAPPWVGLVAALSTVLLGKAWLAVDLVLLGAVPLGGLAAYLAAGAVTRSAVVRCWAALAWAVFPVATIGTATGRLDVAAAQVLLPPVLVGAVRLVAVPRRRLRHAFVLALGVSLLSAFAPVLWPLLSGALLLAALLTPARGAAGWLRRVGQALVVAAVPLLLLAPWSFRLLAQPGLAVQGPGRVLPALLDPQREPWRLALLDPGGGGGTGMPLPPWVTVGLLVAAAAGLLRRDRYALVVGAWSVALLGLVAALGLPRLRLPVIQGGTGLPGWSGSALQLTAAGLLLAAVLGAEGLRSRLSGHSFGWRHLVAAPLTLVAVASPVALAVGWVLQAQGAPGETVRREAVASLPFFARTELAAEPAARVLVLAPGPDGVAYDLTNGDGTTLGATATPPEPGQRAVLAELVSRLLTDDGSAADGALATRGVRYVTLPAADDPDGRYARALDGRAGLVRRSTGEQLLWEVSSPSAPLTLLDPGLATRAAAGADGPTQASPEQASRGLGDLALEGGRRSGTLPDGPAGRLLVLAEADDPGWVATLDGQPLDKVQAWGWAAGFALPSTDGGRVEVRHRSDRSRDVTLTLVGLGAVLALAAPTGRRRGVEGFEGPRGSEDLDGREGAVDTR